MPANASTALERNAADQMVDENGAAEFLNMRPQTLAVWRSTGRYSLPFVKLGRLVRYRMSDLIAFVESRRVMSTGEADSL